MWICKSIPSIWSADLIVILQVYFTGSEAILQPTIIELTPVNFKTQKPPHHDANVQMVVCV